MTFATPFWTSLYQQGQQQRLPEAALEAQAFHNDLTQDAAVHCAHAPWVGSPAAGVRRILLERDGGEVTTRATSIVAYGPASRFAAHSHPRGEEILVLTGVFSDHSGHYPAGSYLRNPPGSSHAPFSDGGCLLFVKLQQFAREDSFQVALLAHPSEAQGKPETLQRQVLFTRAGEHVELIRFNDGALLPADLASTAAAANTGCSIELLVLQGGLMAGQVRHPQGSWVRLAVFDATALQAEKGSLLFIKCRQQPEAI